MRMLEQRADEHEGRKLKQYTEKRIRVLSNEYEVMTRQHYVELKDAIYL